MDIDMEEDILLLADPKLADLKWWTQSPTSWWGIVAYI